MVEILKLIATVITLLHFLGPSPHPLEFNTDCLIAQRERWQDGGFIVLEYGSVKGPARFRLYAGIVPGIHELQFSYLGETFGEVRLPASRPSIRPSALSRGRSRSEEARP